jgi:ketosteroid isomerase-like protein
MSADEDAIRALLGRAVVITDEGDIEDYGRIYADDAVWSAGTTTQNGLEEIMAATGARRASGATGPGSSARHVVTPLTVEVESDTAEAVSYFLLLGDTGGTPQIRRFGRYQDTFVRTTAGWRISSRRVQSD